MSSENRRSYRLPFRTKFVVGTESRVITGNAINISAGGIFVMTLDPFPRETICRCVFQLEPRSPPISCESIVKRVIASTGGLEETPGMGMNFTETGNNNLVRIKSFMEENKKNFELASTILSSGEPDLVSLEPLVRQMHLPPHLDLGELRFYVERILRTVELIESGGPTVPTPATRS